VVTDNAAGAQTERSGADKAGEDCLAARNSPAAFPLFLQVLFSFKATISLRRIAEP
jgi:hypothetical protein